MVISDKIRGQIGEWVKPFKSFIEESGELEKIYGFLKSQVQAKKVVIPASDNVFKSFALCPPDKVRAVVILMDPYPTVTKEGVMVADGVPLSCKNTGYLQPSLQLFYEAIEAEYCGFNPDMDYRADNSYLLTEEGILLLNSSLTTEKDKPGSHAHIWQPFMQYLIEEVLNKYYRGLPIVLCGAQAQKLEKYINPLIHHVKCIEHPAAAAHQNRAWDTGGVFRWMDIILNGCNGYTVTWYRRKGQKEPEKYPEWVTEKNKKSEQSAKGDMPWEK